MTEPTTVKLLFGDAETEQKIKAIANELQNLGFPNAELYARGFLSVEDDFNNLPEPNRIAFDNPIVLRGDLVCQQNCFNYFC